MPQIPGTSAIGVGDRRDRAVARGRADDLDERAGRDARSDGAVVRVEAAHGDRDALGGAGTRGPSAALRVPRGRARRQRLVVETIAEAGELRDRVARGTPSAAARPMPRSTSPCVRRRRCSGRCFVESFTPASTAGTKSASSTQLAAASNTSGATFRQCQIFDHHHSDEYVPPIGARSSGACARRDLGDRHGFSRRRVVLPQPRVRGQIGLPARIDAPADGPVASTGSGVDPVVSTPIPITRSRREARRPRLPRPARRAPTTRSPSM